MTFLKTAVNAATDILFHRGWWKILAIGLCALLVAFGIHWVLAQHRARIDAEEAAQAAQAEAALLTRANSAADQAVIGNLAGKTRISQKETQGLARTKAALAANPAWAQQPIPNDVLSSLQP